MQCQRYLPVYHSLYDPNLDTNSSSRPLYNSNGSYRSGGNYNNYVPPSPPVSSPGPVEILRQTMLMQEATFRDQVQELHCLYNRQKELMGEVKNKQLYMNQFHLESQSSNSFPAKFSYGLCQATQQNPPFNNSHHWPSTANPDSVKNGGAFNNSQPPESKGKMFGGKFLDLELPAEAYADCEDEESIGDAQVSDFPMSTSHSSNKLSTPVIETYKNAACSFALGDLNELPSTSYSEKLVEIIEKEGMYHAEPDTDVVKSLSSLVEEGSSQVYFDSSKSNPSRNLDNNCSVVQALPCCINRSSSGKAAKASSGSRGSIYDKLDASSKCSPSPDVAKFKDRNGPSFIDLNCSVVEYTDGFTAVSLRDEGTIKRNKSCGLIDINMPCDPFSEEDPPCEVGLIRHDYYKDSCQSILKLSAKDDKLLSKPSSSRRVAFEIDLEVPASPEMEECPPPRGESENNLLEDGGNCFEDLAKVAAETIVFISSSKSQPSLDGPEVQKYEASDSEVLEWFAELISSLSSDPENIGDSNSNCNKGANKLDDYEAMTLELTEMKAEEHLCCTVDIESVTCSTLLTSQIRRGRTKRSKRKDFQREVLPSLASLSRYEVTEDMQMIEGLMEAAGTPWQLGRTRRTSRLGRKPRAAKQVSSASDVSDFKDELFVSWGEVNRRPRKRRSPASPSSVLTRWLEYSN